jgi:neutral ceramidase
MAFLGIMLFIMMLSKPIDRAPVAGSEIERMTMDSILEAEVFSYYDTLSPKVAYGRVNITPDDPMPMAGYSRRDAFEEVHDSLYVHLMLIRKAGLDLFLVSADLLIFPDELRDLLISRTADEPNAHLYLSASHTHNGLGGWAEGFGGELIAGDFHPEWLDAVSSSILREMVEMRERAESSTLRYFETDASEFVKNRLVEGAPVDGKIRGLKITRQEGDSLVLFTYSGHPTLLDRESLELSNDYPGATIRRLENRGYAFAMFMAGMVGSHRITNVEGTGYDRINNLADKLSDRILSAEGTALRPSDIRLMNFEIPFGPSQVRLMKGLAARDWLFSSLLQPLQGPMDVVRMGNLYMVSTPCDFSGELFPGIDQKYKPMIITSFNGDYIGYITEDSHYDSSSYMEVMTMNWVRPHYGSHFQHMINTAAGRAGHR